MLNETQRNFRRQIKELEREGLLEKREKAKRVRNYSLAAILIFAWNIYAAYTWVRPFLLKFTKGNITYNITPKAITGVYDHEKIANYIRNYNEIVRLKKENVEIIKRYLEGKSMLDEITLKANLSQIVSISKSNLVTVDDLKQLDLIINEDILNHTDLISYILKQPKTNYQVYDQVNNYIIKSNDYSRRIRGEIINIFKQNGIDYAIDPNTEEIRFSYKVSPR
ncbi:hypothetical protein [Thermobrachium celere]|uniref:hypothetical protein n=1 Tax=Thermobrachium celere TaxID=53422 RepID=UPI001942FBDB|nr:hypothetical protein [Thermobrachium celere]GFR35338.1 hypothetical protein TCEA9_11500 [Thermobrachium celere]